MSVCAISATGSIGGRIGTGNVGFIEPFLDMELNFHIDLKTAFVYTS